jgi:hypothetical protein
VDWVETLFVPAGSYEVDVTVAVFKSVTLRPQTAGDVTTMPIE